MRNLLAVNPMVFFLFLIAPVSANSQPTMRETTDCKKAMMGIRMDFIQLGRYVESNDDKDAALWLSDIAGDHVDRISHIRDLLEILMLIASDGNRDLVRPIVISRIKEVAADIELYIEQVNLYTSGARNKAIVSTGGQLKIELRKLQTLLSPALK